MVQEQWRDTYHMVVSSGHGGEAIIELHRTSKIKRVHECSKQTSLVNESNRSVVLNVKRRVESIKESSSVFKVQKVMRHLLKRWQQQKQNKTLKSQKILNNYVKKFTNNF